MEGTPLDAAKEAAAGFLDELPADVRVGIVSFGPTPTPLAAPTTDRAELEALVDGLTVSGETALYDGVVQASEQFTADATDRVVVLLSDGGDTESTATLADARAAAGGLTVQVVDLVTPESDRAALDELAAAGHGSVSSALDPEALGAVYQETAQALVNRYRITYRSPGHGASDLTVRLTTADGTYEHSRSISLPEAPVVPSTTPATAATAAADGAGGTQAAEATAGEPSGLGLAAGAGAIFLALLLLGFAFVPWESERRVTPAEMLKANRDLPDRPTASELTRRLTAAAEGFLERRGQRDSLALTLDVAGISLRTGEFVVLGLAATVVGALAGLAVAGPLGLLLGVVGVPMGVRTTVRVLADRRRAAFADALPDTLQLLTGALRSGHGLLQSLDTLAREAPEPGGGEFRRVLLEVRVGRDPGDALRALADRMQSDDFEWVIGAIEINREIGGDLARIIDNVAETMRDRQRMHRQIRSLTAEGRLSGYILTGLPVALALLMLVTNPGYIGQLGSGAGLVMLVVATASLAAGWAWIRRICRLEF
jgi:tight adherence protein B